jgi:hypothetical protein
MDRIYHTNSVMLGIRVHPRSNLSAFARASAVAIYGGHSGGQAEHRKRFVIICTTIRQLLVFSASSFVQNTYKHL